MIKDIIAAAENSGEIIRKYFGNTLEIEEKSTIADFKTKADLESEQGIIALLSEKFPNYNILSEEAGSVDRQSEYTLVIDPLDGTNNFVLGIPNFTVSIGLLKGDRCVAGVTHAPLLNQTYSAEEGKGAFCNGKPISVSQETVLERSTVSYTCGYINNPQFEIKLLKKLQVSNVKRYLTNWSPAFDYCLLASGKIETIINNNNELYDYIAGKIIAREAGAIITDFRGKLQDDRQTSQFVASNKQEIHSQITALLSE